MIDLTHLSYSSINYWLTCGQAFNFKYLQGQSEPRSPSLVFGSCIHAAIASYLRDGLVLLDAWQEAWDRETAQDDIVWNGEKPTELFNYGVKMLSHKDVVSTIQELEPTHIQGQSMVDQYVANAPQEELDRMERRHNLLTRDFNGLAIEQFITLKVPGVPLPIVGFVDLIEEPFIPVEIKTSSKSWDQARVDKDLQLTFYVAALNQAGLLSLPCIGRYYIFVKNKTPKPQPFETERTFDDVRRLFNLIQQVYNAMDNRIFIADPTSWKCSEKHCGHWEGCRGGIGGIR